MVSVPPALEVEAPEIDAASVEGLLTGNRDPANADKHPSEECPHTRIRFVAGSGFQCADCAADVSDLD